MGLRTANDNKRKRQGSAHYSNMEMTILNAQFFQIFAEVLWWALALAYNKHHRAIIGHYWIIIIGYHHII